MKKIPNIFLFIFCLFLFACNDANDNISLNHSDDMNENSINTENIENDIVNNYTNNIVLTWRSIFFKFTDDEILDSGASDDDIILTIGKYEYTKVEVKKYKIVCEKESEKRKRILTETVPSEEPPSEAEVAAEELNMTLNEYYAYLRRIKKENYQKKADELGISYEDCVCIENYNMSYQELCDYLEGELKCIEFNEDGTFFIELSPKAQAFYNYYMWPSPTRINIEVYVHDNE